MSQDWMILLQKQNQLGKIMETNRTAQQYGLTLSEQDAQLILKECGNSLREQKRVEFGEGITPKIIYEFCDSDVWNWNSVSWGSFPMIMLGIYCTDMIKNTG